MALKFLKSTNFPFLRRPKAPAELSFPSHFLCPISLDLMKDPVILPTGITYDRRSIETWLEAGNFTCPVTNQPLLLPSSADASDGLIPNHSLRRLIQDWCLTHRCLGVESIPTPKIPVTAAQVVDTLCEISTACSRGDRPRCADIVAILSSWAAESERNRRCISSNGAARVLSAVFLCFPCEEFLSAFVRVSKLDDEETLLHLSSLESINSIVSILRNGSLSGRMNAVQVLKDLLAASSGHETEESAMIASSIALVEEVARLITNPISPQVRKTSLIAAYHLAAFQPSKLAEVGLVPALLEMIVDAEKSLCEKALLVFDRILESQAGRERAAAHALAIPVLAKKMFRVSDLATEAAVSAMWNLCGGRDGEDWDGMRQRWAAEALQVGTFQKLLMLLQVGCGHSAKEKAGELLRLLNGYRGRGQECVEITDLKGLKRKI
ncbi:hypothetical protein HPP92_021004 [Vanilla planifolia]|uniref:U-box domain-containing protein n=1 Tax=Vanilla planifolia TaxID=51239 RepID=A0A835Q4R1_VANPL|nr:hypothetical protein HPP92_021316 [Vanilla planifolia]KAG0462528.1 hypothetical protein HPP92_021004 [Vanilla planifolia]